MSGFHNYSPEELLTPEDFKALRYDARKLYASLMNVMINYGESSTRKHTETLRERLKLTPAGLLRAEAQLVEHGLLRVEILGQYREYTRV